MWSTPAPEARWLAGSRPGTQRGRVGWLACDVRDEFGAQVTKFDVAVLGRRPQDAESLVGGAAALAHDHTEGLVDDAAGLHGGLHLLGELLVVRAALSQCDAAAGLRGE